MELPCLAAANGHASKVGAASLETDRGREGNPAVSLRQEPDAEPVWRHVLPAVCLPVAPDDRPNYEAGASTNAADHKGTESTTAAVTILAVRNYKPHQRAGSRPGFVEALHTCSTKRART